MWRTHASLSRCRNVNRANCRSKTKISGNWIYGNTASLMKLDEMYKWYYIAVRLLYCNRIFFYIYIYIYKLNFISNLCSIIVTLGQLRKRFYYVHIFAIINFWKKIIFSLLKKIDIILYTNDIREIAEIILLHSCYYFMMKIIQ